MIGIYKITNICNKKLYIGSSINMEKRFISHKRLLNKNKHHSYKLQASWNKHGENNFIFEILEELKFPIDYDKKLISSHLESLELYYINTLDAVRSGYNVSYDTGRPINRNTKKSIRKGIRTRRKRGSYKITNEVRKKRSEGIKNSKAFKEHLVKRVEFRRPVLQLNLTNNTMKEWKSSQECSDTLSIPLQAIRKNLCGETKTYKGCKFIYK